MNITTKSIYSKIGKSDGLRICIMRRIKPEYKFDIWIPRLSPPEKLLKEYVINKQIPWKDFTKKFEKQVLKKNKTLLLFLIKLSSYSKVTLLCQEKSAKYCHRSLVLKECFKVAGELLA